MNSAELVELIREKFQNRVKFLEIRNRSKATTVLFLWGGNEYMAVVNFDGSVHVHVWSMVINNFKQNVIDNYQRHVEDRLNGNVRNEAGELVNP